MSSNQNSTKFTYAFQYDNLSNVQAIYVCDLSVLAAHSLQLSHDPLFALSPLFLLSESHMRAVCSLPHVPYCYQSSPDYSPDHQADVLPDRLIDQHPDQDPGHVAFQFKLIPMPDPDHLVMM